MAKTVGDFLIERLIEWGVQRVFGYPGDGITGITSGLRTRQDNIRFIQARHEELAAFMACGHARFTGQPGVCLATSGPGAIHLLNGLYDAKMDHQPVVAIVGQQATTAIGAAYQQEVDLQTLFKDVASAYLVTVASPAAVRHCIDRAMRIAIAERTVTTLIIPSDIQQAPAVESPPRSHGHTSSGLGYSTPRVVPTAVDLQAAADVLNAGERVAMLVGAGALQAPDEVIETAEVLGAGIAKALLGKAAVPDHFPFVTGAIGLLGTRATWQMIESCDTLLMVGSSFPYSEFLPKEGKARGVQIDLSPRRLNLRYPMEVALHGDSRDTLRALLPLLKRKEDRGWREKIEGWVADWWKVLEARAHTSADPINPQQVFWEASSRLPDNCILTADSGSVVHWFARDLKIRRGMMASLSGGLATMCPAVPYALAAKFAYPERVPVAFAGDGAMQMLGINCLITVAEHWREWADPRLVVCVLNNEDLNLVSWEQRIMGGDAKFEASQNLPSFSFAKFAEQLGLTGVRIEDPQQVAGAWDAAFAADRPSVLDFRTDPNVPPLPPHITIEQARNFALSMLRGDPDAIGMVKQSIKDTVAGWLPGR